MGYRISPCLGAIEVQHHHYCCFCIPGLGFEVEEVFKEIKMGFDPQKSLTQMNKNGDVEDRVWGQVMCLNPPVEKNTVDEIGSGNPKSVFDKRRK
jgi:hypothetical protein